MDIRKTFFTVRIVKHLNRLPRDIVDASLFKVRLERGLSNVVSWKVP